jgi:hypothetical protein
MNAILDFLINLSECNDNFKNKLNTNDSIPYDNDNICYSNSFKNVFFSYHCKRYLPLKAVRSSRAKSLKILSVYTRYLPLKAVRSPSAKSLKNLPYM